MEDRIRVIMSTIFDIALGKIDSEISMESCDEWDSLQHMNLLFAIEEEFGLELDDDEVLHMKDYTSIVNVLADRNIL